MAIADPSPTLDWVRAHCDKVIRGNHDKVVAGLEPMDWFNPVAQRAALWSRENLSEEQVSYLASLPRGPLVVDDFAICHGAPYDEDEYVISPNLAASSFQSLECPIVFFGHSHVQGGYFEKRRHIGEIGRVRLDEREFTLEIEPDAAYLLNPGSVGQPRDRDPRAAYAIYDPVAHLVHFRRVPYEITATVEKIRSAGLPDTLGLRLFRGQ